MNNTFSATSSVASIGAVASSLPLRIGATAAASPAAFQDFELLAVAIFRRALTATEIAQINTYYGTA